MYLDSRLPSVFHDEAWSRLWHLPTFSPEETLFERRN